MYSYVMGNVTATAEPTEFRLGGIVSGRRGKTRGHINGRAWSDARGVPYSARVLGPVARLSKNSSKARRAIMPRFALSPVWTSSWSI